MKNIIVGTAGHIDHGKTALVRALTGIDTDRLAEEKRRGISIDLGFAHLEHAGARFGFVDVPGHERFVKNMLAGAGGIDAVLLVIAADESIKPQTREHFEICRLLGIRHGLVALTKADLASPETLELVQLEAAEFVAGSFLEGAPILPVSATTGAGLDALRAALSRLAESIEPRDPGGIPRLPIDRSFTLHGFGTVVTGTLVSGTLRAEDEVEVQPGGCRLRIRGLHVHGGPVGQAVAGQRTAVNLAGIEAGDLRRGMTLTAPGLLRSTTMADCRLELLAGAPPLRHGAPVHFHTRTAELEAEIRLFEPGAPLRPGHSGYARLLLAQPALLVPGDRFIIRMFSPVVTIGGGTVIDNAPPPRRKKAAVLERLPLLESAAPSQRLALWAAEERHGAAVAALAARAGLAHGEVLRLAPEAGLVPVRDSEPRLAPRAALEQVVEQVKSALAAFHRDNPLLAGMPKSAVPVPAPLLEAALPLATGIAAEGETLRLAGFAPRRDAGEQAASARIEALFRDAGLAVPALEHVLAQAGLDAQRARTLLQLLIKEGRLIRVSPELLFHREAILHLRQILAARRGRRFGVPEFKQWTGVSRKYAIPLLEYLDRERVTRREDGQRLIV